jgi:hypothetical protein
VAQLFLSLSSPFKEKLCQTFSQKALANKELFLLWKKNKQKTTALGKVDFDSLSSTYMELGFTCLLFKPAEWYHHPPPLTFYLLSAHYQSSQLCQIAVRLRGAGAEHGRNGKPYSGAVRDCGCSRRFHVLRVPGENTTGLKSNWDREILRSHCSYLLPGGRRQQPSFHDSRFCCGRWFVQVKGRRSMLKEKN